MSQTNEIAKPIESETKKKGRPKKASPKYNEEGLRLNKKGDKVDKRQFTSIKNLEKSKLYQDIMKAKESKKEKVVAVASQIPDSESESEEEKDEFEIEEYIVKPKGQPQVVEVEKIVEKEVIKEVVKPDPKELLRIKKLEEANQHLAKQVSINATMDRIKYLRSTIRLK